MIFQLSPQFYPNAVHTTIIPEEYADLALPGHQVNVTKVESCILIHQMVQNEDYSIWVNNFIFHKPMLIEIAPTELIHSLYYCMENLVKLSINEKVITIKPGEWQPLKLPSGTHKGIFGTGVYRSMHIATDESKKSTLQDNDYVAALFREYIAGIVEARANLKGTLPSE